MEKKLDAQLGLSQKDVDLLLKHPVADVRSQTAHKVSLSYKENKITAKEKEIAEDIFRIIANDVEIKVRQELALDLKDCTTLPKDIVYTIIQDVAQVAIPMIQYSELLTEEDLIDLIRTKDEQKQIAVAERQEVPARVSETLIEEGFEKPVIVLLSNQMSDISDYSYQRLIERFKNCENIHKPLLMRSRVPIQILEKLITVVSDSVCKQLLLKRDLPEPLLMAIVSQTREKAILSLSQTSTENEVRMLVIHLNAVNRLSASLILRAVCVGDMKFFEYALALKAGIPIRNARILIYDSGRMGLERLYEETGLPPDLYPPIQLAVQTYREMMEETEDGYRDHFCRRLVERLMILFDEKKIQINENDKAYFLQKIGQNSDLTLNIAS